MHLYRYARHSANDVLCNLAAGFSITVVVSEEDSA